MASLTYVCFIKAFCASRTLNAMFDDELAERSLTSPLAGTKHMYMRLAIIIRCKIFALQVCYNFAWISRSWTFGDPYFSFGGSFSLPIF